MLKFFLFFLAKLWKLTSDNKLINQNGDWKYMNHTWSLPESSYLTLPGHQGYVEVFGTNNVLGKDLADNDINF